MDLGKYAVDKALKLGMTEAEAYIDKTTQIDVQFSSEIQSYKTSESTGLGLRVAKGKQIGLHATAILNKLEIDNVVAKAINIVKATPEDPNWNGFNPKFGSALVEGIFDSEIINLEYSKIIDKIISGINKVSENERKVIPTEGNLTITIKDISVTNSYHDTVNMQGSTILAGISTKAVEGGDSTGSEFEFTKSWKNLDMEKIADVAAEQALAHVGAKQIETIKLPVIIKNKIAANIIGIMLINNINSESIQKGRSIFADKKGTQVASEEITITDNGLLKSGIRSRPFDDEGHKVQKLPIIEKGILKNFIYDHYRAKKEKVESTGNARRPYFNSPTPQINNLILKVGEEKLEEMIKDTKRGLLVEQTIGEWLSNSTSGELNATITHGTLIENGELTKPVNNIILAGNFFDIIKNKIEIIGKDISNDGFVYSPSLKIAELTLAGK